MDEIRRFSLDSPVFTKFCDLSLVIPKIVKYLRIVFTQLRSDPFGSAGCLREFRHNPWHLEVLAVWQFGLEEHFPGQVLRIAEHVFGTENPAGRYLGLFQLPDHAVERQ